MVQCERRKNTKQYQGHAAAQKSAAWPAERHNTSGAYPAGAPRFCVFAFMYFVPRRLSYGTAEETGVPRRRRRLPRSDNVCPGGVLHRPQKNAARRAGTQNFMCKIPVCHASLFRRCRRVLPAWCRPPEPRPWEHPPNLSMPPASAHCRKRVISHPRHPSWRWASPWGSSASRSAVAKGPGAS